MAGVAQSAQFWSWIKKQVLSKVCPIREPFLCIRCKTTCSFEIPWIWCCVLLKRRDSFFFVKSICFYLWGPKLTESVISGFSYRLLRACGVQYLHSSVQYLPSILSYSLSSATFGYSDIRNRTVKNLYIIIKFILTSTYLHFWKFWPKWLVIHCFCNWCSFVLLSGTPWTIMGRHSIFIQYNVHVLQTYTNFTKGRSFSIDAILV